MSQAIRFRRRSPSCFVETPSVRPSARERNCSQPHSHRSPESSPLKLIAGGQATMQCAVQQLNSTEHQALRWGSNGSNCRRNIQFFDDVGYSAGHFEGERLGMSLPLLKCLRTHNTHCGRHFEPFSGQKCTRLQDFFIYDLKIFPQTSTEAPRCLDLDINFRYTRHRSHCSCFTKRTLGYRRHPGDIKVLLNGIFLAAQPAFQCVKRQRCIRNWKLIWQLHKSMHNCIFCVVLLTKNHGQHCALLLQYFYM